jgi:uncharacterized protein (DUF2147 family)
MHPYRAVLFALACIAAFSARAGAQAEGDSVLGRWYTEKCRAAFDFFRCGLEYKARMIALERPDMVDSRNPADSLKTRKIDGIVAIYGLHYDPGKRRWTNGKVYNPEDGRTYSCCCWLAPDGIHLFFRGYLGIGILGGSQTWTRERCDKK